MINLDNLVSEALKNAREDREKTLEAYEKVKKALNIESADDLNKAMLVGDKPVKLLEQLTRSNEQIVRLAQILQRKEEKMQTKERVFIDLDSLEQKENEEEIMTNNIKTRVESV